MRKRTKNPSKPKKRLEFRKNKNLTDSEFEMLKEIYLSIINANGTDIMTTSQFCEFFSIFLGFQEIKLLNRILLVFDADAQSIVRPEWWLELFGIYLHGSLNRQISFCFSVYDIHHVGRLTKEVIRKFVTDFPCGSRDDQDEFVYSMVETLAMKLDIDRDGLVSFDDYRTACLASPGLLECLGQIIPDMGILNELLETGV